MAAAHPALLYQPSMRVEAIGESEEKMIVDT